MPDKSLTAQSGSCQEGVSTQPDQPIRPLVAAGGNGFEPGRLGGGNGTRRGSLSEARNGSHSRAQSVSENPIHPSWLALIQFCRELGYGELERLSIQDGLPVLAETVRKKCRFTR